MHLPTTPSLPHYGWLLPAFSVTCLLFGAFQAEGKRAGKGADIEITKTLCANPFTEKEAWNSGPAFEEALLISDEALGKPVWTIRVVKSTDLCDDEEIGFDVTFGIKTRVPKKHNKQVLSELKSPEFNQRFGFWMASLGGPDPTVWNTKEVSCPSLSGVAKSLCPEEDALEFDESKGDGVECKGQDCVKACCKRIDVCKGKDEVGCGQLFETCWFNDDNECEARRSDCMKQESHEACVAADCQWIESIDLCTKSAGDGLPCKSLGAARTCNNRSYGWCSWTDGACQRSADWLDMDAACAKETAMRECYKSNEGACEWVQDTTTCRKRSDNGLRCGDVPSENPCNNLTDGHCLWVKDECKKQKFDKARCWIWEDEETCNNDSEGCKWNKGLDVCARADGDGIACWLIESEWMCNQNTGGMCDWMVNSQSCQKTKRKWDEICAAITDRVACRHEENNRCIYDNENKKCLAVELDGVRCETLSYNQNYCDNKTAGICSFDAELGCQRKKTVDLRGQCEDQEKGPQCLAVGGCVWDRSRKQCEPAVDICSMKKTKRECSKAKCAWGAGKCTKQATVCRDNLSQKNCGKMSDCIWKPANVWKSDGVCWNADEWGAGIGREKCEEVKNGGLCKERDDCIWESGKKDEARCRTPEEGENEGECSADVEHHDQHRQEEHCASAEKIKHCEQRGCSWKQGKCEFKEKVKCIRLSAEICCKAPGCKLDKSRSCYGVFEGWR